MAKGRSKFPNMSKYTCSTPDKLAAKYMSIILLVILIINLLYSIKSRYEWIDFFFNVAEIACTIMGLIGINKDKIFFMNLFLYGFLICLIISLIEFIVIIIIVFFGFKMEKYFIVYSHDIGPFVIFIVIAFALIYLLFEIYAYLVIGSYIEQTKRDYSDTEIQQLESGNPSNSSINSNNNNAVNNNSVSGIVYPNVVNFNNSGFINPNAGGSV